MGETVGRVDPHEAGRRPGQRRFGPPVDLAAAGMLAAIGRQAGEAVAVHALGFGVDHRGGHRRF